MGKNMRTNFDEAIAFGVAVAVLLTSVALGNAASAGTGRSFKGPIGLQGLHGKAQAPVWYRHLKIKVLN